MSFRVGDFGFEPRPRRLGVLDGALLRLFLLVDSRAKRLEAVSHLRAFVFEFLGGERAFETLGFELRFERAFRLRPLVGVGGNLRLAFAEARFEVRDERFELVAIRRLGTRLFEFRLERGDAAFQFETIRLGRFEFRARRFVRGDGVGRGGFHLEHLLAPRAHLLHLGGDASLERRTGLSVCEIARARGEHRVQALRDRGRRRHVHDRNRRGRRRRQFRLGGRERGRNRRGDWVPRRWVARRRLFLLLRASRGRDAREFGRLGECLPQRVNLLARGVVRLFLLGECRAKRRRLRLRRGVGGGGAFGVRDASSSGGEFRLEIRRGGDVRRHLLQERLHLTHLRARVRDFAVSRVGFLLHLAVETPLHLLEHLLALREHRLQRRELGGDARDFGVVPVRRRFQLDGEVRDAGLKRVASRGEGRLARGCRSELFVFAFERVAKRGRLRARLLHLLRDVGVDGEARRGKRRGNRLGGEGRFGEGRFERDERGLLRLERGGESLDVRAK